MKTTVFYHSADFDGIFCREIARKFLPDAELIGWNFGDDPQPIPDGQIYVMDLPVDRLFGFEFGPHVTVSKWPKGLNRIIWIDHHKSSIETHPTDIPGYRIDGVAACRLAWQWFNGDLRSCTCEVQHSEGHYDYCPRGRLPSKEAFIDRSVIEPLAVRLAGEYDIWDKRDPDAELFQHGLRSRELNDITWKYMLGEDKAAGEHCVADLLEGGKALQFARANEYRDVITDQGFDLMFEGIQFLACNSHECDIRSQLFAAGIKPHHQALLGFTFTGKAWRVSMYRIDGIATDVLSIAKKFGGGGHEGACGFETMFPIWMIPFKRDGKITPLTADARVWARDWADTIIKSPTVPFNEGAMITWFANAIMAGYDLKARQCATAS